MPKQTFAKGKEKFEFYVKNDKNEIKKQVLED